METSAKITKSVSVAEVNKKWWVVDASGITLGRLATQVAILLRGKHKPSFTPHIDCGDFVIVVNADKIQLAKKRVEKKEYLHHTQYPGGLKRTPFQKALNEKPAWVIEHAVKGMLPKNKLGRKMINNLKVYEGEGHPHQAQMPLNLPLKAN